MKCSINASSVTISAVGTVRRSGRTGPAWTWRRHRLGPLGVGGVEPERPLGGRRPRPTRPPRSENPSITSSMLRGRWTGIGLYVYSKLWPTRWIPGAEPQGARRRGAPGRGPPDRHRARRHRRTLWSYPAPSRTPHPLRAGQLRLPRRPTKATRALSPVDAQSHPKTAANGSRPNSERTTRPGWTTTGESMSWWLDSRRWDQRPRSRSADTRAPLRVIYLWAARGQNVADGQVKRGRCLEDAEVGSVHSFSEHLTKGPGQRPRWGSPEGHKALLSATWFVIELEDASWPHS